MGKHDGDIIFKVGDKDMLRIRGSDGMISVEGRPVRKDTDVADGLRAWFEQAKTTVLPNGDYVFSSGRHVESPASVTLEASKKVQYDIERHDVPNVLGAHEWKPKT